MNLEQHQGTQAFPRLQTMNRTVGGSNQQRINPITWQDIKDNNISRQPTNIQTYNDKMLQKEAKDHYKNDLDRWSKVQAAYKHKEQIALNREVKSHTIEPKARGPEIPFELYDRKYKAKEIVKGYQHVIEVKLVTPNSES